MTTKALVLSGGGPVGIAWESGLIGGLARAGIDLSDADLIVGTSAGSFVGARLAMGMSAEELAAPFLALSEAAPKPVGDTPVVGARPRDMAGLMTRMQEIASGERPAQAVLADLGEFALTASSLTEEAYIQTFGRWFAGLPEATWPDRGFACTAIDCETGEFKVWDKAAGVGLTRAVASSCAVPGVYPPISIQGRRYMDGGVRSSSNADLARGHDLVVIVTIRAAQAVGPLAERAAKSLAEEIALLEASGARVEVVSPDAASFEAFGVNMMDPSRRPAAAKAGYAQGLAGSETLAAAW